MRRVIGIANQKGGVGKTTTAVNLSAGLGRRGRKTLLVDMDSQGNATSGVGIEKEGLTNTIYELLLGYASIREVIHTTEFDNLFVIPANMNLFGANVELQELDHREERLKNTLKEVEEEFDYIIIDAPPSLGVLTINVLVASEWLIIPVQCEYYALEGLKILQEAINRVKRGLNPGLKLLGILLTMFDGRTNLSRQVTEEVRRYFGSLAFTTVIGRSVRLGEAPSHGKPVFYYDERAAGAMYYELLCEELERKLWRQGESLNAP
ncbi:ParA family protein [Candidatus Sumerlaeota bacterium]|nr:ParA family protein [Candidatus Sumerlaeota bacterium]